jgi:hypothetical protein
MRIYLVLAFFWLIVALFVLLYPRPGIPEVEYTILGTNLSAGWLLLIFVAWNLVRWRLTLPVRREPVDSLKDQS